MHMGGSDDKGDGLASQPRRYRVPGQPLLNRHQVGGVSRSPDGLSAQREREPIRGRPAVREKWTYGGRPGQRVEEQGTWASRTQKHSEAGYGRPVDRGAWTAKTVKQPWQQPAHPEYPNYWAPLTRKRHTMPHSAQPQHINYSAPRTRKRHQQEQWPQRPTESSDPTQHAKGRTGDCPGPRKGATTRRNVTQGATFAMPRRWIVGLPVSLPERATGTAGTRIPHWRPLPITANRRWYRPLSSGPHSGEYKYRRQFPAPPPPVFFFCSKDPPAWFWFRPWDGLINAFVTLASFAVLRQDADLPGDSPRIGGAKIHVHVGWGSKGGSAVRVLVLEGHSGHIGQPGHFAGLALLHVQSEL